MCDAAIPPTQTKGFVINIHNVRVMKAIMMTCASDHVVPEQNGFYNGGGMNPHKGKERVRVPLLLNAPRNLKRKYVTGAFSKECISHWIERRRICKSLRLVTLLCRDGRKVRQCLRINK